MYRTRICATPDKKTHSDHKPPVAVAVDLDAAGKPGHVALGTLAMVDCHSLKKFATQTIEKGSMLHTDGWTSYWTVAKAGYGHQATVTGSGTKAVAKFPCIHTFIGNFKRMSLGTHHSASPQRLDQHFAEFAYLADRCWWEGSLFDRLFVAAVRAKTVTYQQLTTGAS